MIGFILLNLGVIIFFSIAYIPVDINFLKPYFEIDDRRMLLSFFRNFFSNLLLVSVNSVFLLQEKIREKEIVSKQIVEERLQAELMLLKSQINPHFLFNALNNIYSLSYLKSDKAPESILLLSRMLRYIIEDCREEFLPLQSEIEYLETFIAFHDIRTANKIKVSFKHDNVRKDLLISPLLFLPLLENGFKYSRIGELKEGHVDMLIETSGDNELFFHMENSVPASTVSSGSGTGLENLKKRLELVYPKKHELLIDSQNDLFRVTLKIDLK